jgi:hypothetical protein
MIPSGSIRMTSGTIVFGSMIGVAVLGVAFWMWRIWGNWDADQQYARTKADADANVHRALHGKSFMVGTPSDFIEGGLQGYFRWLDNERAWGLRLDSATASLRSLGGMSFPLWVRPDARGAWVRHADRNIRLRAYNADVAFVLPTGLLVGDQIRLEDQREDRLAS